MSLIVEIFFWSVLVLCLFGALANRARDNADLSEWATAHALRLTDRNRAMVRYYLLLGALLRTMGGLAGIVLGALTNRALGVDVAAGALWWVWVMGGYLAGASWAELFLTRPTGTARAAALSPRQLRDYLPARLRWALRTAGAVSVVLGVAGWLVTVDAPLPRWTPVVSPGASLGLGLGGAVIALLVEALQRLIVRRPQPVVTQDLLEADDAMRASSVHSLAGAGLGMVLLVIATISTRLLEINHHLPLGAGASPVVLFLAALIAWRYYGYRAWRVRRPAPGQPVGP